MPNRDDFLAKTRRRLAERVNFTCSNPTCYKPTSGPSTNPDTSISIGVAAHIAAAASGGKRFDPAMSPAERKNIKNGIWLCQSCAKLIDSDEIKFTTELLHKWKRQAEGRIAELLEGSGSVPLTGSTTIIAQANFLDQLAGYLSSDTENDLEQKRYEWRAGKKENVKQWLRSLKKDKSRWGVIVPQIKAKILRFEAGLELDTTKDTGRAKEIADAAFELDPSISNEARIRALIARQEFGAKEAISFLEHQNDIDSRNMLAAFYLELNDKENCQRTLDDVFRQLEPNAESHRIKALLLLVQKIIDQALIEIEKASELAPTWTIVRYTSAVLDYFGALSVVVLPDQLMLFPEPVDMVLVKQNAESVRRLQKAETTFSELASTEEDETEAELLQAWLLSCKMINPEKQDEAIKHIRLVLDSNPSNFHAIYWALARDIDIEWHRSREALVTLLSANAATINHIIALIGILVKQKAFKAAEVVLGQTKDVFSERKAENLWLYWNVQVLILAGRISKAQKLVNRYKNIPEMIRAQGLILVLKASKARDRRSLVQFLEDQYGKTGDPLFLLQICESEFRNQNWGYVADRADDLVNIFHTADIMRLAIYAVFNARRFTKCLELINEYSKQIEKKELPSDLRQMRSVCFHAQGQIRDAIRELEEITLEKSSVELLIRRAQLYYESGDLKKLSLVGRQLVSIPQIEPSEALGMAHVLRQEDFALAQYFWKMAVSKELPDSLIGGALSLGYSLGLDKEKELFGLYRRMQDIAQTNPKGAVQLFSLAEFIETQKRFNQQQIDVNALYQEGKIPVHILADRVNISLTDLHHSYLLDNEKQPNYISRHPLFIRHGGKTIGAIENAQQHQLNMDITALLLASHLGVLGSIEKVFRSIRMPSEIIPSLVEMRDKTLHHQPSRLDVANQIIDLVNKKLLKIADDVSMGSKKNSKNLSDLEIERKSFYEFQEKKGYVLDFLGHLGFYKSFADVSRIIYAKNIADYLLEHGKLAKDMYPVIIQNLGTEGGGSEYLALPDAGMPIFCFGNIVSILADANILELACSQFDVYIQNEYLDQIKNEVAYFDRGRKQQFEWIGSLVEKLRGGLDAEKYLLIPPLLAKTDEHDMYGLQSIFSLSKEENNLIWVDDRCLNGYSNINGIPIVGVNEILLTIYKCGEINQRKYYELLHRMRVDNLCFVPVNADEIVYFIRQSQIKDRTVLDTSELSTVKQYIASAVLRGHVLQKPPVNGESPNPQGELEFLVQTAGAISDAVERIWSLPEMNVDEKDIYSSWIINNLFVSHLGLSEAVGLQQKNDNEMNLSALSLATLITRSLTIANGQKNGEISLQQIYLNWVYERVLRRSFESNPLILKKTTEIIKKMLVGIKDENTIFDNVLIDVYIQRFCSTLPAPIFVEMKKDDDFASAIGMRSIVTIGNWELELKDFWYAAHEAVNGKEAEITPIGLDYMIVFQPHTTPEGITGVLVRDSNKAEQILIQDSGIELLNESKDIQAQYLKKHSHWFDLPLDEFEKISAEIISTKNLQERVERALKWKEANLKLFYSQLFIYLRDNRQFTGEDLIPSNIDGMLRFYRLTNHDNTAGFSKQWDAIVETLIKSYGVEHALERASCVPLSLPESLLSTIDGMSLSEKRVLVKKLLRVSKSPIAVIQFVKLLVRFGVDNLMYRRLANYKINSMLTDDFTSEVDAFMAVLHWVNYQFVINTNFQNVSGESRLLMVWAHSHHIYSIFASLGVDSDWLLNTFKQNFNPPVRLFEHETNFENNILNIRNVNTQIIITYGITYLIDNYHEFMGKSLKEAIVNFVTINNEEQILPHPYLLGNPARAENPLDSFLGKDLSSQLRGLMGEEAKLFDYMNWKSLALVTIQNLRERCTSISSWIELFTILGVLAFEADVKNELSQTLRSINYVSLFEENIELGEKAIYIASIQLSSLQDSTVPDYLRDQIIEISELLDGRYPKKAFNMLRGQEKENITRLAGVLLEVALNVSKKKESPEERALEFQKLGIEIARRWNPFATIAQPVLQYLCEILPPNQAKHLWKPLLFMRSIN